MPDFVICIVAFCLTICTELALLGKCLVKTKHPNRYVLGLLALATAGLWVWFVVGVNQSWHQPPYKTETLRVVNHTRRDGTVAQFLENEEPEVGWTLQRRLGSYGFYPEGTVMIRRYYHPWQSGIHWMQSSTEELVLPKGTTTRPDESSLHESNRHIPL